MKKTVVPFLKIALITESYHGGKIGRFYSNGKRLIGLY
jgi:hypothetical protein